MGWRPYLGLLMNSSRVMESGSPAGVGCQGQVLQSLGFMFGYKPGRVGDDGGGRNTMAPKELQRRTHSGKTRGT